MTHNQGHRYQHKKVKLKYNQQEVNIKINDKQDKLEKINNWLKTRWNLDNYLLKINDISIESNDAKTFENILLTNSPPITIYIVHNTAKTTAKTNKHKNQRKLTIHYNDQITECQLPSNIKLWTQEIWNDLQHKIQQRFNVKPNFELLEIDEDGEYGAIDCIDDLDSDFKFHLYVRGEKQFEPIHNPTDDNIENANKNDEKHNQEYKRRSAVIKIDFIDPPTAVVEIKANIANPGNKIQKHRIYFLGPSNAKNISLHFPRISTQSYLMKRVREQCKHLVYLDVKIPWNEEWNANVLEIAFMWLNSKDKSHTIVAKQELNENNTGYYHVEMNKEFGGNDLVKKGSKYILQHLLYDSIDFKSFEYCSHILQDIKYSLKTFERKVIEKLLNEETQKLNTKKMVIVYRMHLIKNVTTKWLLQSTMLQLNLNALYGITECCVMDQSKNGLLLLHNAKKVKVAYNMYITFFDDIQRIFNSKQRHEVIKSYPVYNLFRYFEQFIGPKGSKSIKFKYDQKNKFFLEQNHKSWMKMQLLHILKLDLKIGTMTKRQAPFEMLAVRLCWLIYNSKQDEDNTAMNIFINIFKQIASNTTYAKRNFIELFSNNYSIKKAFALLSNKFPYWRKLIECITVKVILEEKQILNKFRHNLVEEIGQMTNETVVISQVCSLIRDYNMFDIMDVRIALLENRRFTRSDSANIIKQNLSKIMERINLGKQTSNVRFEKVLKNFMINFLSAEKTSKRDSFFQIF
eukprot:556522_1